MFLQLLDQPRSGVLPSYSATASIVGSTSEINKNPTLTETSEANKHSRFDSMKHSPLSDLDTIKYSRECINIVRENRWKFKIPDPGRIKSMESIPISVERTCRANVSTTWLRLESFFRLFGYYIKDYVQKEAGLGDGRPTSVSK